MSRGAEGRHENDAELVEVARTGDKDAFGELVRRHRPLARQLALRMLADTGLADEAVQEATLQAYLSLTRLRCPARFGPWLCGITLNLARRCLRERRRLVLGAIRATRTMVQMSKALMRPRSSPRWCKQRWPGWPPGSVRPRCFSIGRA